MLKVVLFILLNLFPQYRFTMNFLSSSAPSGSPPAGRSAHPDQGVDQEADLLEGRESIHVRAHLRRQGVRRRHR